MNAASLRDGLATRWLGRELLCFARIPSTNDELTAMVRRGSAAEGLVVVAARQARGRGTGDARWHSDHEEGLWFSFALREPLRVRPLSFLPGIALVDWLREELGVEAWLKWPNDVLVAGRKLAGFLVEGERAPDGAAWWVVGCGVNVEQRTFEEEIAARAVSLRMASGRSHAREDVLRGMLHRMEELYARGADLVAAWPSRSAMVGREVRASVKGRQVGVWVHGLTDDGHLLVEHGDGRREAWVSSADGRVEGW
jgi:BirA family biotin operon repressor/biotin-[acetyl-CoA-carboxylase] ligase